MSPRVPTYGPEALAPITEAGEALRAARAAEAEALAHVRALVLRGYADGLTERDMAKAAGVDRMTVRAWLGKAPAAYRRKGQGIAADEA